MSILCGMIYYDFPNYIPSRCLKQMTSNSAPRQIFHEVTVMGHIQIFLTTSLICSRICVVVKCIIRPFPPEHEWLCFKVIQFTFIYYHPFGIYVISSTTVSVCSWSLGRSIQQKFGDQPKHLPSITFDQIKMHLTSVITNVNWKLFVAFSVYCLSWHLNIHFWFCMVNVN